MALGDAPLSIFPSPSFTIDISKHTSVYVHTVATKPGFQESSLAQKSGKSPGLSLYSLETQSGCRHWPCRSLYFPSHLEFLTPLSLVLL